MADRVKIGFLIDFCCQHNNILVPSWVVDKIVDILIANGVKTPLFCKDCESACPADYNGGLVCTIWGAPTEPNRYCSEGKRRSET